MRPVTAPDPAPIEDLERDIHNLCIGINAATYELLTLIREFDERVGWLKWGLENCAEWLAWRCDLSMATAREKVRTAHALKELPLISQSFSTGDLSYSKVRELTRVATRGKRRRTCSFRVAAHGRFWSPSAAASCAWVRPNPCPSPSAPSPIGS